MKCPEYENPHRQKVDSDWRARVSTEGNRVSLASDKNVPKIRVQIKSLTIMVKVTDDSRD